MIILDTHTLIWFFQSDTRIGDVCREMIDRAAADTSVLIPAICAWEIALIERSGRSPFDGDCHVWFKNVLASHGFELAPLLPDIAIGSVRLDWSHKDPADRIIVSTARHHGVPLLTADGPILAYAAAGHVEAIDARR